NASDDRRLACVCTDQVEQRPQRRRLRQKGIAHRLRSHLARGTGSPGAEAVPHAPAVRTGRRDRVCRRSELPRLHRGHHAAVHERRSPRTRVLMKTLCLAVLCAATLSAQTNLRSQIDAWVRANQKAIVTELVTLLKIP